jgi:hypothetical protein
MRSNDADRAIRIRAVAAGLPLSRQLGGRNNADRAIRIRAVAAGLPLSRQLGGRVYAPALTEPSGL